MNEYRPIIGYCQTQKKNYSVILTCLDAGDGTFIKGTVECDYTKYGGTCESPCSIRDSYPEQFR